MLGDDGERGSLVPFGAALAVFLLVVIALVVFTLTRGGGPTEEQRVGLAVVGQNDALQRQSYADYRRYTCTAEQRTEATVIAAQQESSGRHGARYVDDVTDVKIDGDRATATVTYHFENDPDSKRTAAVRFVNEDGRWKVCSAYG